MDIRTGIIQTANALGIDPLDLATAISYETAGTFNPTTPGPTTRFGQHRGFIQFGEPQAKQHGVDWNDPIRSQLGENGAVASYLRSSGVKPGMGLLDIYSAINAGAPGLYNRSDAAAGGAPGTVRDKVMNQMSGHRKKAAELLGMATPMVSSQSSPAASVAADTMAALGKGGGTVTPDQIAQGAMAQSAGQEPEQPRGLLGNLFGNPDTMASLAMAFNSMRLNPDPNLAAVLSAQVKERRTERQSKEQRNSTAKWLRSQGLASLADAVETGALTGAQAISLAKDGGSKDGTAAMQNYAEYNRILQEQGPEAANRFWQMSGGKGLQPQFGTIPAGYELVQDMETGGYRMQPIKGGPADIEAQQNVAAQQQRAEGQQKYGQVVLENVDRIREKIKSSSLPVAGLVGSMLSKVPGTDAYDVGAMADTIRANIGFERLNEMRKESPTGGALGQVTERELAFLQNSLANLEQSQSQEQFERSLDVVENAYKSIMDKFSAYPNAAKYGFSNQQPSSGMVATHRFNPQTGKVEEVK